MNDDNLIIARAKDRLVQCRDRNYMTHTPFLDSHQQSLLRQVFGEEPEVCFWGGYPDAERVVMLCLPDYMEEPDDALLTVIRASRQKAGGRPLSHRDYLGSLTGIGIRREMTGDILVREDGADIIVLTEIAGFLCAEYDKAGRVDLQVKEEPLSGLLLPSGDVRVLRDTVASVRLDNVTASAFGISRTKAAELIRQGLVFVDHLESRKPDQRLEEGTLVSVRHKGRFRLTETGKKSRKGRTYITMEIY